MPALSFRLKLLLAMMGVVVGVTGATLYATHQRVEAGYRRVFEAQFETQVRHFFELRQARLDRFGALCQTLARSVRLVRALDELGPDEAYDVAFDQFETLATPNPTDRPPPVANAGPAMASHVVPGRPVLGLLDARGQLLIPAADRVEPRTRTLLLAVGDQLERAGRGWAAFEGQQAGYLAVAPDPAQLLLLETIVTPMRDHVSGEPVGAILLGLPRPGTVQEAPRTQTPFADGIWLGGQLHSASLPPEPRAEVARLLGDGPSTRATTAAGAEVVVDGVPHRVFARRLDPNSPFPPAYQVSLYSLAELRAAQRDLARRITGFGAAGLVGAFAFSWVLSHGLSVPIRELVRGTRQIQQGNYAAQVPFRSRDELGRLASSFNEMAAGLALKEKYRSLLHVVADPAVAEELVAGGAAPGGEVRRVTVLFCDIRGFTAATQGMPPRAVIEMLNEHMTALTQVVHAHHGIVDKFVGDLIMAVFGAPRSRGNDAGAAARCALGMHRARERLNRTSAHVIQMGIGLASGEVVAGCMGSSDRLNYTVLGARVNLASRLCGQARAGEVVLDQETLDGLGPGAVAEALPPLSLKGFDEPVTAYRLSTIPADIASS